jgi:hypothetical protein
MGHFYLEHSFSNQSASKVAGSGNAPGGLHARTPALGALSFFFNDRGRRGPRLNRVGQER